MFIYLLFIDFLLLLLVGSNVIVVQKLTDHEQFAKSII